MTQLQLASTSGRQSKKRERELTQETGISQPLDEREAKRLRKEEKKARKAVRLAKKLMKAEKLLAKENLKIEESRKKPPLSEIESQTSDSDTTPTSKISTGS